MVNNCGIIIHKTKHKKGHRHDYDIYKKNHPVTPKQVVSVFDLGYLGVEKDFPEQISSLPNRKKRRPKRLSQEEKECNQNHSRKRIVIEHTICRNEKVQDNGGIFRNRLRKIQQGIRYSIRTGKLQNNESSWIEPYTIPYWTG